MALWMSLMLWRELLKWSQQALMLWREYLKFSRRRCQHRWKRRCLLRKA
jgi:hypothetical protein